MIKPQKVNILGMELDEWNFASCIAHFAVGPDWATLYDIESKIKGRGHATTLLREAKSYYEAQNRRVGGFVAMNPIMEKIYKILGYREYK